MGVLGLYAESAHTAIVVVVIDEAPIPHFITFVDGCTPRHRRKPLVISVLQPLGWWKCNAVILQVTLPLLALTVQ